MAFREPLVPAAVAVALGVFASSLVDFEMRPVLSGIAALVGTALACRLVRLFRPAWLALMAALMLGGIAVDLLHHPGPPPRIDFSAGEQLALSGCVVEPPALSEDREQFVLELARGARVRVNFFLKEGERPPDLHYGQQVELVAALRHPHNFQNPGAFDFVYYLARRDIHWLASANARTRLEIKPGSCGNPVLSALFRAREFAVARLDQLYASNPFALGMSRALLVGDGARLDEVWKKDFQRTGTYHALIVSGAHLAVLTATLGWVLRIASITIGWRFFWIALISWAYAIICGGTPPVVRAAAGVTLYWLGRTLFRKPRVLNLLAAVTIAFLLADPRALFDASFQLSFLAVAMIAGIAAPLLEQTTEPYSLGFHHLENLAVDRKATPRVAQMRVELRLLAETLRWARRIPERVTLTALSWSGRAFYALWHLFLVSAVIQFGLALLMVVYFHRLSITGLTANLAIVPLMNLMVPLGFLIIATNAQIAAAAGALVLEAGRVLVEWHARMEPAWRIPDPPWWISAAFLSALVAVAVALRHGQRTRFMTALAAVGAFALLVAHPFPSSVPRRELEITAIDVGQGDSLLVASPNGRLMLVDAGGFPVFGNRRKAPSIDIGEDVVTPALLARSITHVDVIAVTHAHGDHIGGLLAAARNFRPREVWTGAFPEVEPWTQLRDELNALGITVRPRLAGEVDDWDGVRLEVLSPPADYQPRTVPSNNDSLAFRLDYRDSSFLLTGDVEKAAEQRMVGEGRVRPVDVLKVAHHGSKTSTTAEFLAAAQPRWALISDGVDNIFRHPHPDVLARLAEARVHVLRTDRDGMVSIRTDGRRWTIGAHAWPGYRPSSPIASRCSTATVWCE